MSKQLAISSAFAVFAMAAMTLSLTADHRTHASGEMFAGSIAEAPEFKLPSLPFLSGQ